MAQFGSNTLIVSVKQVRLLAYLLHWFRQRRCFAVENNRGGVLAVARRALGAMGPCAGAQPQHYSD
jgi:hypothetical protein